MHSTTSHTPSRSSPATPFDAQPGIERGRRWARTGRGRFTSRDDYQRARRLARLVYLAAAARAARGLALPAQPEAAQRYAALFESQRCDPLQVPLQHRLSDYSTGKDIPF